MQVKLSIGTGFNWLAKNMPDLAIKVIDEFGISPKKVWYVKPDKLGGVVGKTTITDCVTNFKSPWFFGSYGFVLKDSQELPFVRFPGKQRFFNVDYKITGGGSHAE